MLNKNGSIRINGVMRRRPSATAYLSGDRAHPDLEGRVRFYEIENATFVVAEFYGLPTQNDRCRDGIFAFHIHEGCSCTGDESDSFKDAGSHYNPLGCPHPYHKGDMPPIFSARGNGYLAFVTDRFTVDEIVGRTVILHSSPDDFTTQPSGNAGSKIACGKIVKY